jgi:hypothetical protein
MDLQRVLMADFTGNVNTLKIKNHIAILTDKNMEKKNFTFGLAAALFFLTAGLSTGQTSVSVKKKDSGFRAAVVKIDITPDTPQRLRGYNERISTGVHDRIYHRILALDDGTSQFFLISTDAASLAPGQYDHVADQINNRLGIDPLNFWWSLTHTHSAPEIGEPGIIQLFMPGRFKNGFDTLHSMMIERTLIDGIIEAQQKLSPARLSAGWGFSQANINRRAIDIDGKAHLGMNPDGPVDRRIGMLRIEKADGSPMVLVANYPIHGTVMGGENLLISGDVAGTVSEYVEKKTGVPLLFINGAAGNLAPIYSQYPNPARGHLSQFCVLLGDKILKANQDIRFTTDQVILKIGSVIVESPRKDGLGWPSGYERYMRTTDDGKYIVRLPVRFLKINDDIAIWSAPVELFCEISNEIRDRSPYPYTFYYGYTNGTFGYVPSEAEWEYAGYETSVSVFTPSAARDITETVLGYLLGPLKNQ